MESPTVPVTAVDLSRLPAPEIIEHVDYEVILAEMVAELQARDPRFTALVESDPAMRILQVCAWREALLRQRFNDRALGLMVAYAGGGDLDHLGALFGVARLVVTPADVQSGAAAVMEDDDAFRRRIILAPDGYSVAGPEAAYVFHTLSAHPDVLDATASSPAPGEVLVTVLSRVGDGVPAAPVLVAVNARLNTQEVRPLTDQVTVQAVDLVEFAIDAQIWVYSGPDPDLIVSQAQTRLNAYLAANRRIGRDVTLSALYAALHVEGVQRVVIASPAADVVVTRAQLAACSGTVLTFAGDAE